MARMNAQGQFGSVVLVNPNNLGNYVQGMFGREHLGLGYLAAELKRAGFKVHMIDSRILAQTPNQAARDILSKNPSVVGFSVIAKSGAEWCEKVASLLKVSRPKLHISIGNYFPSLQPKRALESVPTADSIVVYEGDYTFPELITNLAKGKEWQNVKGIAYKVDGDIHFSQPREVVQNLDLLPAPVHTAGRYGLNEFAIEGSRGCYQRCIFCSIGAFFGQNQGPDRWRSRSAESIAKEIGYCLKTYPGIRKFRFVDPDFCGASSPKHIARLEEIVKEFKKIKKDFEFIIDTRTQVVNTLPIALWRKLKEAGLAEVYLGVESVSGKIKKKIGKESSFKDDLMAFDILEMVGIRVRYGFMMITPWTRDNDIVTNAKALRNLGFPRLDKYFQEMYVVPGTRAVELTRKVAKMWFDHNGEGEYYSYELPKTISNLRSIARALTTDCLWFLKQHQRLHEMIGESLEKNKEEVTIFRNRLNDLSYKIFMSAWKEARGLGKRPGGKAILNSAKKVTKQYGETLNKLERDFGSGNWRMKR